MKQKEISILLIKLVINYSFTAVAIIFFRLTIIVADHNELWITRNLRSTYSQTFKFAIHL